jgi:hypothetical protein
MPSRLWLVAIAPPFCNQGCSLTAKKMSLRATPFGFANAKQRAEVISTDVILNATK